MDGRDTNIARALTQPCLLVDKGIRSMKSRRRAQYIRVRFAPVKPTLGNRFDPFDELRDERTNLTQLIIQLWVTTDLQFLD